VPLIRWLFDPKFCAAINQAAQTIPLLRILYLCSVPIAKIFEALGIRPNVITTISNFIALSALAALVFAESPWMFSVLWVLALFVDMADGIVARATKQSSAQGSFYDHMSDQVKVILLFFSVGLRYDDTQIWALTYAINGLFLLTNIINQVYSVRSMRLVNAESKNVEKPDVNSVAIPRSRIKQFFDRRPRFKSVILGVYASFFVMYGNAMVLLVPLSFSRDWAVGTLLFFGLVTARSLWMIIRLAMEVNRQLTQSNTSWK
jgi:phosphatidylglycerophosphate synthase